MTVFFLQFCDTESCLNSPWMMLKLLVWWEQRELRAERLRCGRRRKRSGSARRYGSLVWSVGPGSGTSSGPEDLLRGG